MIGRILRVTLVAAAALTFAASLIASATAAPKRSRDACMQLASQRGFNGSGDSTQAAAKRNFVIACMQGKQG